MSLFGKNFKKVIRITYDKLVIRRRKGTKHSNGKDQYPNKWRDRIHRIEKQKVFTIYESDKFWQIEPSGALPTALMKKESWHRPWKD